MNPNPAEDVDEEITREAEPLEYGQRERKEMFFSAWEHDGREILMPRRPELTGDTCDALMADLTSWVDWLVSTFRIQAKIPPCWIRHGGLREELLALFFFWQHTWLPARDPALPVSFMREFDWSLGRIDRYWKVACDNAGHKDPAPVKYSSSGIPEWSAWWSNPEFNDSDTVVAQLQYDPATIQ